MSQVPPENSLPDPGAAGFAPPQTAGDTFDWPAAVVESADDAIVCKTLDGRITSWNKGAERLFGYTAEEAVGEMLKAGLGQCGAEVTAVGSAAEAIEEIRKSAPDLLISDIGMPDEDGYALMQKVRVLPAAQGGRVPAIALTAYARTEDRLQALRAGYQMHVTKPVELTELAAVVASLAKREG